MPIPPSPTLPAGKFRPARGSTRLAAAVFLAVLALLTTSCADGGDGRKVATADTGAAVGTGAASKPDDAARARDFAKCMRDNGVPVQDPDPKTGKLDLGALRGGADGPTLRKAMEACRDKAPQSISGGKVTEKQLDAMRQLARCMRDAGIPFDDPGPDGFDKRSFPSSAPGFAQAMQKCQQSAAAVPPGGAK